MIWSFSEVWNETATSAACYESSRMSELSCCVMLLGARKTLRPYSVVCETSEKSHLAGYKEVS